MQIDTVIQPSFTQHRVQRALYSLWKTYCRAGQIPLWQSLPCHAFGPYLPATCVIGLSAADRSVIRISGTQMDQLLRSDSRGQSLDSLCAPAIKPRFKRLVSQVFARQSPMSLTVLPLLDRQRQCRRALVAVDLAEGHMSQAPSPQTAPFSELGPVHYVACPCPNPQEAVTLVQNMRRKKGAQPPARPYLRLVS